MHVMSFGFLLSSILLIINGPNHSNHRRVVPSVVVASPSALSSYSILFFDRLTKLASLLVKTLAKPLSKRIKHDFSRYDATKRLLIAIGQNNHTVTSYMTIWSSGYRVRSIKPLEEEKAMKDGAEFIGESFIFGVSVGLLLWEYNRSAESAKANQEKKRQEIRKEQARLQAKLHALDVRLKAVEDAVQEQTNTLLGIVATPVGSRRKYRPPPETELVPIDEPIAVEEEEDSAAGDVEAVSSANCNNQQPADTTNESSSTSEEQPWWKFW